MNALIETPSRIEPCLLESVPGTIADSVAALSAEAATLGSRLHPSTVASLADLVRVMNCYYSNLIEGHNTKPRDIERALAHDFDGEENRRNLQVEAYAHIRVQRMIDGEYAAGTLAEPASGNFLRWIHREFYHDAPEAMLWVEGAGRRFRMEPGEFRASREQDVTVGRHMPPASGVVDDFMKYFELQYGFERMGMSRRIIAMAAAHHRLNYIHPFPDGNGRVSRLMSHAMGHLAGIGAGGLWSISRGLARGIRSRQEYKQMMDYADSPRQGDLDGRGNLSQKALSEYVDWFLRVCLDQVRFMAGLFDFDPLAGRLKVYVERKGLKPEAFYILERVLLQGEMPRGEAERITGLKERSARTVLASLIEYRILESRSPKGPVSLRVPSDACEILFPRVFGES